VAAAADAAVARAAAQAARHEQTSVRGTAERERP
jgi:hypothetical protein